MIHEDEAQRWDGTPLAEHQLRDRVALVTGASGGIGQALARRLARGGAIVAAVHGRRAADTVTLVEEIERSGGRACHFGVDVADPDACVELVQAVRAALGDIDVLIPGAGVGLPSEFAETNLAIWQQSIDVNLRAPFLLAQGSLPAMVERGFGRILFISSVAAMTGGNVGAHYAAAKAGLNGLTHYLASLCAADGVTVNAIAPALIEDTDMLPGDPKVLVRQVPVRRLGRATEVADLAMAILANPYLTNQVVSLDGGIYPR